MRSGGYRGYLFIGALQVLVRFRGLVATPIFLRYFGVERYGAWTQMLVAIGILVAFGQANLHNGLLRFFPSSENKDQVFWSGATFIAVPCLLLLAVFGVTFVFTPGFAAGDSTALLEVRTVILVVVARIVVMYLSNVDRAEGRPVVYVVLSSAMGLSESVAIVAAYFMRASFAQLILLLFANTAVLTVVVVLRARAQLRWSRPSMATTKKLLAYCLPTIPVSVSAVIIVGGDRFLLEYLNGSDRTVGVYSTGYLVCGIPMYLAQPLLVTLLPRASKLWNEGNTTGARDLVRRSQTLFLMFAIPCAAGIAIVGHQILIWVRGGMEPEWTTPLLALLALGGTANGMSLIAVHVAMLMEQTQKAMWTFAGAAVTNLGLNAILIPWAGMEGAAFATVASYGFIVALLCWMMPSIARTFDGRALVKITAGTAFMIASVCWIELSPLSFGPIVALAIAVYAAVTFGWFRLSPLALFRGL